MSSPSLTPRGAAVLDAVVERFIRTGQPVGSVVVTRALPERVSAATVRNVLAELERLGYLEQPHTSAGRMPTTMGYQSYVERLQTEQRFDPVDEARLLAQLDAEPIEVEELLRRACSLLADLSDLVGLVSAPPLADTELQHIDFVALENDRVMAIVVARSGQVQHRLVSLGESISQEQLDRAANYLVRRFAGRSLRAVAARIRALHSQASERLDSYERQALRLGAHSLPPRLDESQVLVEGASHLLARRDFAAGKELREVFETLEKRRALAHALAQGSEVHTTRIVIGAEPLPVSLGGCSLIAATYWSGGHALGSMAVLGPTRLPYARAIALVGAVAKVTSSLFEQLEP